MSADAVRSAGALRGGAAKGGEPMDIVVRRGRLPDGQERRASGVVRGATPEAEAGAAAAAS